MDVSKLKLHDTAGLRWGENVSPFFDATLARLEAAIATLPAYGWMSDTASWPPAPLPPPTVPRLTFEPYRAGADPADAGVAALAQAVAAGMIRSIDGVEALVRRTDRLDPQLHVWAGFDGGRARQQARECDEAIRAGGSLGPLHGVPLGIKDIIAVEGWPTAANSRVAPADWMLPEDADAVALLRQAGALILGKTATTEYAYADPAPTVNPWNPAHTPGGSSSGSAAGVAAGLMSGALGTQTAGSVLRPAAFCGIVGFKPTTERISRTGVVPLARSLDHVGTLTRSVADAALLYAVLSDATETATAQRPPRLVFCPDLLSGRTDDATRAALPSAARALEQAGAEVQPVGGRLGRSLTETFCDILLATHQVIMAAEAAAQHLDAHPNDIDDLGPRLRAIVQVGALVPAHVLLAAQSCRVQCWRTWQEDTDLQRYDALIVPAAPGAAPKGLESTGDASLNAPWSLLGLPAITIPIALTENGLPLGMQLVASYGEDARLLTAAHWCEQAIGFDARPVT
ncbi:MAG: amidase [Dehalococcoidia bacterium]